MEVGIVVSWGRWNLCQLCDVIKSRETILVGRNSFVYIVSSTELNQVTKINRPLHRDRGKARR